MFQFKIQPTGEIFVNYKYDEERKDTKHLATIYMEVDGYYVVSFQGQNMGYHQSSFLHMIADYLDQLNGDWDKELKDALENV